MRNSVVLSVFIAISLAACGGQQISAPPSLNSGTEESVASSNVGVPHPGDRNWVHYGNDLANTRFQDVDQINPRNAGTLRPAWVFHTGVLDPQASLEVSPVVINGIMYVTTGHDDVFALDAGTGKMIWQHHPALLAPLSAMFVCCGRDNRGVAFGNGKVFIARLDGVLEALNARTGSTVWQSTVLDFNDRYAITMAPQFVNGLVIVGSSGGEFIARGQVAAFDANTGARVWRMFTTVPGPTWKDDSWLHGGGLVWQTPAVDPGLGLVYINTSNASPDVNGHRRAGDNLFTSSIVALDVSSGTVRWAFQTTHHDLWDYDAAQPSMLFTLKRLGQAIPALGECSKNGNYYVLDRRTGAPLFPVTEVRVPVEPGWQHPSPTQPASSVEPLVPLHVVPGTIDFNALPPDVKIAPTYTPPQEPELLMQPGDDGACEFPPAAFSPRTGFVYYGGRYEPTTYHSFPNNTAPNAEGLFLGSTFEEDIPGVHDFGVFGATDTATGRVVWKIQVPQPAKSGLLVAGDLVFFGEGNGLFHAADARTGMMLFTFNGTSVPHGGGAQAAPVAYVCNGTEFVANAFGGNVADRPAFGPNPLGDAIIAFALPPDSQSKTASSARSCLATAR
jgi:alcohol dehydrogenase (cytochrome c)